MTLFEDCDVDGDRKINLEELKQVMKRLDMTLKEETVESEVGVDINTQVLGF